MTGRALLAAVAAPVAVLLTVIGGFTVIFGGGAAACTAPAASPTPAKTAKPPDTTWALTAPATPFSVRITSSPGPADASSPVPASRAPEATGPALTLEGAAGFDHEQAGNAATIIATAAQLGVPVRGWIIAVATAIQESSLRNLRHGDTAGPDSLGLFQQRDAWGSRQARLNPAEATRMFLLGGAAGQNGLLDIGHWQDMPLAEAAQAVQHSGNPSAYASHEVTATQLVAAITGMSIRPNGAGSLTGGFGASTCDQPAGPAAAQAVAFAREQIGVPYTWGGNGPADGGWDCSGLTTAAYAAGGITLPRTAQTQYNTGPHLPAQTALLPGDLVFFGTSPAHITHVGIYVGDGNMIDAPHARAKVRVENYRWTTYLGATRPAAR